ncbi:MAG TPA: DUF3147 family protein [Candidatus Binataceae bacterium]|nr:DUF3147 family protein [Candidatus Binataceae bacterium]
MLIRLNPSALKRTRWYEYALRFLLGGAITAIAGIIAKELGPVFGGLFLAFPAILPASATLVESHEREKKQSRGLHGARRGRQAAGVDAIGAAIGTIGLIGFALWTWRFLPQRSPLPVLAAGTSIWFAVSLLIWFIRWHFRAPVILRKHENYRHEKQPSQPGHL